MQDSSGFRLRVDSQLRQQFISACRARDRAAAQVLREFMRNYVAQHYSDQQEPLFREERELPPSQN
ncbi:hypothetical protein [Xanthomonas translucens]|uniref:hypothetical protein n=1 Tax=Xanthomonas campestris pv. translucens TaxID=343 RepID=UPI003CE44DD1